jgi:hypothetical protein
MKPIILILMMLVFSYAQTSAPKRISDREQNGFLGPVKKMFAEWTPVDQPRGGTPPGTRCRQQTSLYDTDGRLLQNSVYPGPCGSDEIRETYTYAKDGSRTSTTQDIKGVNSPPSPPPAAPPPGEAIEVGPPKTTFQYDSSGRVIEMAVLRPGGKLIYKTAYKYDKEDRTLETISIDPEGTVTSRRVYTYEGNQRVPSSFSYFGQDGRNI